VTPDEEIGHWFQYLAAALAYRMLLLRGVDAPIPAACRSLDDMPARPDELDVAAARAILRDVAERHQYDEPRDANPGWLYIGPGQDAAVLLDAAQVAAARTVERALIRMRDPSPDKLETP
jgi:hypothetical protein